MRKIALPLSLLGATLVLLLFGAPAEATAFRTWVSGVGSDANPCTRTAPCASFAQALTQTAAGGEIDVLDSGQFGNVDITQALTIVNVGALATQLCGTDFSVHAGPSDVVTLHGLAINTNNCGTSSIFFTSGAALHVENCLIYRASAGIDFEPSGASQLFVSDTIVRDNSDRGILIRPTGVGTADVILERVQAVNNSSGIVATAAASSGTGTVVNIAVRDSVASGNSNIGILARSQVGGANVVMTLDHVAATSNGTGIEADGSDMGAGGVAFSNTQVSGNGTGLVAVNGGVLVSFQNNYVIGNGTDGAPTTTVAPK